MAAPFFEFSEQIRQLRKWVAASQLKAKEVLFLSAGGWRTAIALFPSRFCTVRDQASRRISLHRDYRSTHSA